ncbi:MAG: squalene synthase HpnC [Pseudolabrys sp.]
MTGSAKLRSGKTARDENFPVASWLIKRRHRPVIRAFYEFVRIADDIADHPGLDRAEKLSRLDGLEASLLGRGDEAEALRLGAALAGRGLSTRHAQDLLRAFRQDVVKSRYADWDELIAYCSLSAMPVGRFVLEVHGETNATWPASDALCAALQIINHLQDCAADYRLLDRVYIPLDMLAARKIGVEALGKGPASPALKECLTAVVSRTATLLQASRGLEASVIDARLALEISVIQSLAGRLVAILRTRDPLSEAVHLTKAGAIAAAAGGGARSLLRRVSRMGTTHRYQAP